MAYSYVIDADNYLFKKICFETILNVLPILAFIVKTVPTSGSWFAVMTSGFKTLLLDSKAGRILSGVSFWDAPTAEKIVGFIDKATKVVNLLISTGTTWLRISKN